MRTRRGYAVHEVAIRLTLHQGFYLAIAICIKISIPLFRTIPFILPSISPAALTYEQQRHQAGLKGHCLAVGVFVFT